MNQTMSEILEPTDLLIEEEVSDYAIVSKAFNLMLKAVKARSVYPVSSPLPLKFLKEWLACLNEVFQEKESLKFLIDSDRILFKQSEIYRSQGKSDDFAFAFFRDGIKSFEFHKGVSEYELNTFIDIISRVMRGSIIEDDVASLLWEADFKNVSYELMDDIFNIQDLDYKFNQSNPSDSISITEVNIPDANEITPESFSEEQYDISSENSTRHELLSSMVPGFNLNSDSPGKAMLFNAEDKIAIKQIIENDQNLDPSKYIIKLIFEILVIESNQAGYDEVLQLIIKLHDDFIKTGDFNSAGNILSQIKELIQVYDRIGDSHLDGLNNLLGYCSGLDRIHLLVESFNRQEDINQQMAIDYLKLLPNTAVPHLIDALGKLEYFSSRRAVCKALELLAVDNINILGASVNDSRWYVVRNIVMILGHIGNQRAIEYFKKTIKHPDIRVRKETLAAITKIGGETGVEYLLLALKDESEKLQLMAIRQLVKQKAVKTYGQIENIIRSSEFIHSSEEKVQTFLEAIAQLGGKDAFKLLRNMAKRRFLFNSKKRERLRISAIKALGCVQCPETIQLLKDIAKSRNKEISRTAKHSINMLTKEAT
jgi:HEAT repeat protein